MRRIVIISTTALLIAAEPLLLSTASTQLAFEVATIKLQQPQTLRMAGGSCHGIDKTYPPNAPLVPPLGRCLITFSLSSLITVAYSPDAPPGGISKISGGPAWVDSDFWQIEGKAQNTATATEAELKQMLQTLLVERFKLQFHHEMKDVPGFGLIVAKSGLKIAEDHGERGTEPSMRAGPAGLTYNKAPLSMFANYLSGPAGGPVIDKTGLAGPFSFTFQPPPRSQPPAAPDAAELSGPSIFTAIQEQLGLRLEPLKVPADFIVIDHAERPTPN